MTKGGTLRNIAIEVVNLDDHLAEGAVKSTVQVLSTILPLRTKTLIIEPHDDVRGVWARLEMDDPEKISPAFDKHVVATFKALINMQLHGITSAVVHVFVDEKEEGM